MEIEKQVCSSEHAQKLKELGVEQDSYFYWYGGKVLRKNQLTQALRRHEPPVAAFTVAELGELLRNQDWFEVWADFLTNEVRVWFTSSDSDPDYPAPQEDRTFVAETEADARALALIYLIENGMVKT